MLESERQAVYRERKKVQLPYELSLVGSGVNSSLVFFCFCWIIASFNFLKIMLWLRHMQNGTVLPEC